ncbi:MAG TPA: hypothetical protein PLZ95_21305, partial [Bryobacteraceae bacterium]|nr:hypothetical protein [Bryobacteraceae bacterium]
MGWDFIKILEALTKLYDWLSKEPRVQRTLTWIRRNCAMVAAILVVFIVSSLFLLRPLVVGPSGEAEMLVRSFDGDSTLTEAELKSLWTLTTTRKAVQD